MNKTVLITGSSTGIGKETALFFAQKGWNVAATMRTPEKAADLSQNPNIKLYKLDVTDQNSIDKAINDAISDFAKIDVVVNNAGYGAIGMFEKASWPEIQRQFDTNVFGCFRVIQAILPHMRANKAGIIINVTSMGGHVTFPGGSLYHSTKFAMEGFSETLWYELRSFGIKVKLIEPGPIKTDFYTRSMDKLDGRTVQGYEQIEEQLTSVYDQAEAFAFPALNVAKTIYKAANSNNYRLRYTTDLFSWFILRVRRVTPDPIYRWTTRAMSKIRLVKTKSKV